MSRLDISSLEGEDLFQALTSGKKITISNPQPSNDGISPPSWIPWVNQAVVVLVHECECQACGRKYSWPNDYALLKRYHRRLGIHYAPLRGNLDKPNKVLDGLPLEYEYRQSTVTICMFCADIPQIIDQARKEAKKKTETIYEDVNPFLGTLPPSLLQSSIKR